MKRAERLYAVVDLLRARSPRPISAARLAEEFVVTRRTIERDIASLQAAGVPVYAEQGRVGGYAVDRDFSLPPLQLDADEAAAAAIGLALLADSPFAAAALSARRKINAVLPVGVRERTEEHLAGIHLIDSPDVPAHILDAVGSAIADELVLSIDYRDRGGAVTTREVEPLGLLRTPTGWLLLGWCRLREAVRGFRLERIPRADVTDERASSRDRQSLSADLARYRPRRIR